MCRRMRMENLAQTIKRSVIEHTGAAVKRARGVGRKGKVSAAGARKEVGGITAVGQWRKEPRESTDAIGVTGTQPSGKQKKAMEPSTEPRRSVVHVTGVGPGLGTGKVTLARKGKEGKNPTDGTRCDTRPCPRMIQWTSRMGKRRERQERRS